MILNETFFNMMVYFFFAKGVFELGMSVKSQITEYNQIKNLEIEEETETEETEEEETETEEETEEVETETEEETEEVEEETEEEETEEEEDHPGLIEIEVAKIEEKVETENIVLIRNVVNTTQDLIENVLKCMKDSENRVIIETLLKIIFKQNEIGVSTSQNENIQTSPNPSITIDFDKPKDIDSIWSDVKVIKSDNLMVTPIIADTRYKNIISYTDTDYMNTNNYSVEMFSSEAICDIQSSLISALLTYDENRDTARDLINNILKDNDKSEQSKVLLKELIKDSKNKYIIEERLKTIIDNKNKIKIVPENEVHVLENEVHVLENEVHVPENEVHVPENEVHVLSENSLYRTLIESESRRCDVPENKIIVPENEKISTSQFSFYNDPEKVIITGNDDDFPSDNNFFHPKNFIRLERKNSNMVGLLSQPKADHDPNSCGPWMRSSKAGVMNDIKLDNSLDPFKSYNNKDLDPQYSDNVLILNENTLFADNYVEINMNDKIILTSQESENISKENITKINNKTIGLKTDKIYTFPALSTFPIILEPPPLIPCSVRVLIEKNNKIKDKVIPSSVRLDLHKKKIMSEITHFKPKLQQICVTKNLGSKDPLTIDQKRTILRAMTSVASV